MDKSPISILKQVLDKSNLWVGPISLSRGQFLVTKGDRSTKLYFVESGSMRAFIIQEEAEHTIRLAYEGSFFGAIDSFIGAGPTEFYIQALRKCKVYSVEKEVLKSTIDEQPKLHGLWEAMLSDLVLQQLEREQDLLTYSPEIRYQRVLSRSPQLFQHIPSRYIAAYLRMTPETLSRIQKS